MISSEIKYTRYRLFSLLIVSSIILLIFFLMEISLGSGSVQGLKALSTLFNYISGHGCNWCSDEVIVIGYRVPRAILGLSLGIVLGISGVFLQASLRNPLAEPYLLGIAGGAAFGAIIAYTLLPPNIGIYVAPVIAALMGIVALAFVLTIASIAGFTSTTIVLAGISVTTMFSAINAILLLQFYERIKGAHFWFFGTLSISTFRYALVSLITALILFIFALLLVNHMNALILGDEVAKTLGIEPSRSRLILLCIASTSSSIVIAFTGPIGFIGLIAPHIIRLLIGYDHRYLVPLVAIISGSMVLGADLVARLSVKPSELPLGAITAALGVPFFLYLLVKSRGRYGL